MLTLFVFCYIIGVSSLDVSVSGKMGMRTLIYYFATTFAAIVVGIILVLGIHPGTSMQKEDETLLDIKESKVTTLDAFLDLIR